MTLPKRKGNPIQLNTIGVFSQIENMTLKEYVNQLTEKGHFSLNDLFTIAVIVCNLLPGKGFDANNDLIINQDINEIKFAYYYGLTKDEMKTLKLLADGRTYQNIADYLGTISIDGVSKRIKNIYRKLGVNNRSQAAKKAIEGGLL